jgi:TRAP-type uncharacterized transport system substrate-binding protein
MNRMVIVLVSILALTASVAFGADDSLTLATGSQKSTYAMMFKNLKQFCPAVTEYMDTTGGFQNLNLITTKKVNMGIVPEDVMEMARRTDPNVVKNVRGLMGLHFNSLHIIILKEGNKKGGWFSRIGIGGDDRMVIRDLRDLKGKKIACFGSAIVTGEFLNERLQAGLDLIEVKTPDEGVKMLKSGEVLALLATAGWPIEWVDNLDSSLFTLASLDESYIKKMGEPYKTVKLNYPKLRAMGVITAAPRNIIAVWNYSSASRIKQIMDFRECIIANLQEIKEMNGSHPSWNDVDDVDDFLWPKYDPTATPVKTKK